MPQPQPTNQPSYPAYPINEADPLPPPAAPTTYPTSAPVPIDVPTPEKPAEIDPTPANNGVTPTVPVHDSVPNKAEAQPPTASEKSVTLYPLLQYEDSKLVVDTLSFEHNTDLPKVNLHYLLPQPI